MEQGVGAGGSSWYPEVEERVSSSGQSIAEFRVLWSFQSAPSLWFWGWDCDNEDRTAFEVIFRKFGTRCLTILAMTDEIERFKISWGQIGEQHEIMGSPIAEK
jgi:hypothetical protein